MTIALAELRREPDFEAPDLVAHDATDVLLVARAAELTDNFTTVRPDEIVVIGDRHGAITLSLTLPESAGGYGLNGVRVFQDPLLHERALHTNARRLGGNDFAETPPFQHHKLGQALFAGAKFVIMQLPKSLAELTELAYWIATRSARDVTLLAGGRVKHMTRTQNDALQVYFSDVQASLAEKKSRLLTATGATDDPADPPFPITGTDPDLEFSLHAYGATFGGATLDHGTRLMLHHLPEIAPEARHIVDLGCGNGSLAVAVALQRSDAEVFATDQSWGAVHATRATARWAGVPDRVQVFRADGCEAIARGSADLIMLNPPFHSGQVVNEKIAHRLIRSASLALAPGGTLLVVYNSHLSHRSVLERHVGPVTQIARDQRFTLVAACKA